MIKKVFCHYRGGRLQGLARNMSGLSTFFYFVACPIFPPKICRLSSFEQKFFSLYQQKMFVKTSILVALSYYTDKVQLQNKFQF